MEEVKMVIKLFKGNKAPGPDGFNLYFFQKYWSTVKNDVWNTVKLFFFKKVILQGALIQLLLP